ncbi:mannitol-1-phosphate 5-dehydrogenase [Thermosediminibacter oceani]|uniref:Mannitol-1-phosphate 5-dehydrogenase n=1 Tax=Thermosediminibacter oceani (strain ATCC BAA-1034 / DSM 16646 / JW/IW-1228P) TaxID=555079 RepID=D9RZF3_THEOJ|nr:mannitol-1-phosphate 5-dehydrogenase [Thermosediminibacter oceani]ADL06851.1 D-mannitol 1-phosphate 5-dehydrogenase [Thermosediminibacter oceani DSM 16646]
MKKAVHFGAGNIGRGFIGFLLSRAGYRVVFVDINAELIETLNEKGFYRVMEKGEDEKVYRVEGVTGILSTEEQKVAEAVAHAHIVTTAVGPGVLGSIAPLIAAGISRRLQHSPEPLNVIACENMVGASTFLKEKVMEHLSPSEREKLEKTVGFPDAAVDRIVPPQSGTDPLGVAVEPYFEWVVDIGGFKGAVPEIPGMKAVENLQAYVERKIYTLNTGHAVAAYLGYEKGCTTIREALQNPQILEAVKGAMAESGVYLRACFGFSEEEHEVYIEKTLQRFLNPALEDPVVRVGRNPVRKLGPKDRLVYPSVRALELGVKPVNLARGIAAALKFDYEEDQEARKLQQMLREQGIDVVLNKVCGIPDESPLRDIIKATL